MTDQKSIAKTKAVHEKTALIVRPVSDVSWVDTGQEPRLPEIGQIRIGAQGNPRRGQDGKIAGYIPKKLDHFAVYRMERGPQKERILFKEVHALIGEKPKEIEVMFLFDDPFKNFYQYYGVYAGRKCRCKGNGRVAVDQVTGEERACPCKNFDHEKNSGPCKPNTILHVILPKYGGLGGIFTFRSTSMRTFKNFQSQFPFFVYFTKQNIAGVPFLLKIQPYQTQEFGLTYAVHMEYEKSMEKLMGEAREQAKKKADWNNQMAEIMEGSLKLLTAPEPEEEVAAVVEEFYPEYVADEDEDGKGGEPGADAAEEPPVTEDEIDDLQNFWDEAEEQAKKARGEA